jgi:AcrR family transcriptional regulator
VQISAPRNKNQQRGRSTRAHLLATATELFSQRGFENTSVELVLERAGASKGSLYHHFANKEALFEAVLDSVEAEVAASLVKAARGMDDPIEALRAACKAWLRLARDPLVRQVVLLDAPAVMGWDKWREIDDRHAFGILKQAVAQTPACTQDGLSAELLAHLVLASVIEMAMVIARSEHPRKALSSAEVALDRVLSRLLQTAGGQPAGAG